MKQYVLHLDGDSFFVSVELARRPDLRGKAVVTGSERSIATALSPQAKALGVVRGMPVFQIRERFPEVTILPSDYESYSRYSKRMIGIVRRFAHVVEEYSVDECFALISVRDDSEAFAIASKIQETIWTELTITASVGLAGTKVLAKVASKWKKPKGITLISLGKEKDFLVQTAINKVWGIGRVASVTLSNLGVKTAQEFCDKSEWWVKEFLDKPQYEIWSELRGITMDPVTDAESDAQKSISRTRSFYPFSKDRAFLFSEISLHVEEACMHARSLGVEARGCSIFLKTKGYRIDHREVKFEFPSASPSYILKQIQKLFDSVYNPHEIYKTTGVNLWGIIPSQIAQPDLFGASVVHREKESIHGALDVIEGRLKDRFQGQVIGLASSLLAKHTAQKEVIRYKKESRQKLELRFKLPFLGFAH